LATILRISIALWRAKNYQLKFEPVAAINDNPLDADAMQPERLPQQQLKKILSTARNCRLKSIEAFGCDLSEVGLESLAKRLTSKLDTSQNRPGDP
jgi:hypothetical protein